MKWNYNKNKDSYKLFLYYLWNIFVTIVWAIWNKTAGYHLHMFRIPIFVKKVFKKMERRFFSLKNTVSSS